MTTSEHQMKISVTGMTCSHCKATVEKRISSIQGITHVNADPERNEVTLSGEGFDLEKVKDAVESSGYVFKGMIK